MGSLESGLLETGEHEERTGRDSVWEQGENE